MKLLSLIEKQPIDANTQVFIVRGLLDPDFSVRLAAIETLEGITISEIGPKIADRPTRFPIADRESVFFCLKFYSEIFSASELSQDQKLRPF